MVPRAPARLPETLQRLAVQRRGRASLRCGGRQGGRLIRQPDGLRGARPGRLGYGLAMPVIISWTNAFAFARPASRLLRAMIST